MRILYAGLDGTVHDRRFVGTFLDFGWDVAVIDKPVTGRDGSTSWPEAVVVFPRPEPVPPDRDALAAILAGAARAWKPDLLVAGPLTSWGGAAARANVRPFATMSWGFDLLVEAAADPAASNAVDAALRSCALLVCDSDTVRETAVKREASVAGRFVQLPWGVDVRAFRPGVPAVLSAGDRCRVLSLRTWGPLYDVPTVLRATALARGQGASLDLILAGDGEDAPMVHSLISTLGLGGATTTPGRIPQEALPGWYASADVYASAAPADGTSISLLEAMACGLPVVVVDNQGNREWVSPAGGFLVPPRDPRAMADALAALAALDPAGRAQMGRHNRAVVEARADWQKNRERLRHALESVSHV